jgi:iron complex outermembrane receptor protein
VVSNDGRTAVLGQKAHRPAGLDRAGRVPQDAAPAAPVADDQSSVVEEVVVTGFRASLGSALSVKRRANGVVDVIKAEDIADFPDANLAESIQRVPGVSIARDAGEGRQITVRGLGPQFTRVRINGVEGQSTASGTDSSGGANRNRAFDFNVFASELFNSITVRKTASAQTEEGSLGATVDLQTGRPFDYKGATFVVSAQEGYNDLSKAWDPRLAVLASNTWLDGKLGALVSVAYTERNLLEEGHGSGGWLNGTEVGGFSPASPFAQASLASTFSPRFPRYGRLTHDQKRLGVTGPRCSSGPTRTPCSAPTSSIRTSRRRARRTGWRPCPSPATPRRAAGPRSSCGTAPSTPRATWSTACSTTSTSRARPASTSWTPSTPRPRFTPSTSSATA